MTDLFDIVGFIIVFAVATVGPLLICRRTTMVRYTMLPYTLLAIIAQLYPLGELLQHMDWGSQLLQYHTSDIGFSVGYAVVWGFAATMSFAGAAATRSPAKTRQRQYLATKWALDIVLFGCLVSLALFAGWELLSAISHDFKKGYDWADLLAATLGIAPVLIATIRRRQQFLALPRQPYTDS